MSPYQREVPVRFGHCDPAGIVFYPRYFDMINSVVEDWFEDGLDASFPGLLYHKRLATPTAHFNVDFQSASRFGDRLTFKVHVRKIGRTSVTIEHEVSCQGQLRMLVRQVLVFIDVDSREPQKIPIDVARRMQRFIAEPAPTQGKPAS